MVALESNFPLSNNIFTIGFAKTIAPTDTGIIINITIFNDFLIISLNSLESSSLDSLEKIGYITELDFYIYEEVLKTRKMGQAAPEKNCDFNQFFRASF